MRKSTSPPLKGACAPTADVVTTPDWIVRLFARAKWSGRTVAQYGSCLGYWDVWYRLRYGAALPLSETPPKAVSAVAIHSFIQDHLAVVEAGQLGMRMTPEIAEGLRAAGYNRNVKCAHPESTAWRIRVLSGLHKLWGLHVDERLPAEAKSELYATWEAERAAVGASISVPMSATNIVRALLAECARDREGIRDAALIVMLRYLTPNQIRLLRLCEIMHGMVEIDNRETAAIALTIPNPVGDFQKFQPRLQILGSDAEVIDRWGALRADELSTDDWFIVRGTGSRAKPISEVWVRRKLRALASSAGIADARGRSECSPRWLRKVSEREWRENSSLVQIARVARANTRAVIKAVRGRG